MSLLGAGTQLIQAIVKCAQRLKQRQETTETASSIQCTGLCVVYMNVHIYSTCVCMCYIHTYVCMCCLVPVFRDGIAIEHSRT